MSTTLVVIGMVLFPILIAAIACWMVHRLDPARDQSHTATKDETDPDKLWR